jgi:RNA polymerase sigma factor (sigma-70 family)
MAIMTDQLPTRASLLSRLRDWNDNESWRVFFETYWKLMYSAARKWGLTDEEAQDVVQETVIVVAKQLPTFRYNKEGSFKQWLLNATRWRALDLLRKRQVRKQSAHQHYEEEALDQVLTPTTEEFEAIWDAEWERNVVFTAMERVKAKADPADVQIFDLCVNKRMSPNEVRRKLQIGLRTVYTVKHRVSALLRQEIENLRNGTI